MFPALQPFFCAGAPHTEHSGADSSSSTAAAAAPVPAGRKLLQPNPVTPQDATAAANSTSSSTHQSANIAMTTLRPLTISVNESELSVWVDAGWKVVDLLQYLANYVTPAAPAGYTLGAFPWFVYQVRAEAVLVEVGPHPQCASTVHAEAEPSHLLCLPGKQAESASRCLGRHTTF